MEKYPVEDTDLLVKALKDVYFPVNVPHQAVIIIDLWQYQQTTMLYAPMDQQEPPGVQIVNTDRLIIVEKIDGHLLDAIDEDIIVILANNWNETLYWIIMNNETKMDKTCVKYL